LGLTRAGMRYVHASDRGGERAAAMYSLIVSAKMNDIDPRAWLADVLAPASPATPPPGSTICCRGTGGHTAPPSPKRPEDVSEQVMKRFSKAADDAGCIVVKYQK
jgi:hypothetical protein